MTNINLLSDQLNLASDGIWYASESEHLSYPDDGNDECFSVEEGSFWFRHRNECISAVINLFPPKDKGTIFDIGGGNGFVSKGLESAGYNVALVEPGITGARNGKKRGLDTVICATSNTAGFRPKSLPAIGLFDVIEHLEDDVTFLKSIKQHLLDDGRLYVTVPSYSFLWSNEDITAGHYRRYSLRSVSRVLNLAGFSIEFSTYIFRFLPAPIFLLRSLPYKLGIRRQRQNSEDTARDHISKNTAKAKILDALLDNEINILKQKKSMKFGGSCLVVARKV